MDDIVQQALARWPNVPAIAGWLRLTARGDWLLTGEVPAGVRITHANMRRFIDRNYAADEQGRWFFQNGPQKVFVSLEYTPWVFAVHPVSSGGFCLLSHTRIATLPQHVLLDEDGQFLFVTPLGVGVMRDTDMESITPFLSEGEGESWTMSVPWKLPDPVECAQREWRLLPSFSVVSEAANDSGNDSGNDSAEIPASTVVASKPSQTAKTNSSPEGSEAGSRSGLDSVAGAGALNDALSQFVEHVSRADVPARFAFNPQPSV